MATPREQDKPHQPMQLSKLRIAILPFVNMSPDLGDEYFADGITEELTISLSGVRELTVIARTSVLKYKGSQKDASVIGKELNVGTLIGGSVRKTGNRVRITVQLTDAATDSHIWARGFDKQLDDIFAVQSEIAERVTKELRIQLLESERQKLEAKPTEDAQAYTLYLRARYHWNSRSEEGLKTAIHYFEESIARDPKYALALVGLADAYSISALFSYSRPITVYPRAKELVQKALGSDTDSAEAHASFAEILMHYSHDWAAAIRELERALQINPNYVIAHVWRSSCYAILGQMEEAITEAKRAQELDPFAVVAMNEVAKNLYYARRYDEAIKHFLGFLEIEPNSAYLRKGLAETYIQRSMFTDAVREIEKAITLSRRSAFVLDAAASVYALANEKRKLQDVLEEIERLEKSSFVPSYGRAAAQIALGDRQKAFRMLEKAYAERSWLAWLNVDPILDPLKKEPTFHSLLRKMNLEYEPISTKVSETAQSTIPVQETFEFESERSRVIFNQLASDFLRDYMSLNFMAEKSGWRSIVEIAHETGTPVSSLYSKVRGGALPFRELWKRGLIEMRLSPGERGRGGEITKIRIAYDKSPVRNYVDQFARAVKKTEHKSNSDG